MVLWGLLTNSWEEKWQAKEKKESYIHLNTEFQRIARRDKKAFLIDQCKEMEGNNRMVKSRDLFKKIEIPREHFMQRWRNICQQIWKTRQWPQDWKRSISIPIPKKGNNKECSNYLSGVLISHASEVMLKILQTSLQQLVNWKLPDVQAGFRKGRGTRDQIADIHWLIEKTREFQKNIYFCFLDYAKAFGCVDHN